MPKPRFFYLFIYSTMADKDWSNLKNQSPKKIDKKIDKKIEDNDSEDEEVVEAKIEKTENSQKEDKPQKEDESKYVYFVNSNTKNLSTMVGEFKNGLFVAKTLDEIKWIRKTEDFQWWFIKEMSKKEFTKSQSPDKND